MSRKNKKIVEKKRQRKKINIKKKKNGSRERKKKERTERKSYPSLNLSSPPLSSQKVKHFPSLSHLPLD
jgi:hypothetical protein